MIIIPKPTSLLCSFHCITICAVAMKGNLGSFLDFCFPSTLTSSWFSSLGDSTFAFLRILYPLAPFLHPSLSLDYYPWLPYLQSSNPSFPMRIVPKLQIHQASTLLSSLWWFSFYVKGKIINLALHSRALDSVPDLLFTMERPSMSMVAHFRWFPLRYN